MHLLTFKITDEVGNRRIICNFHTETTLENMFKTFVRRPKESQDITKLAAIPSTAYELVRNTGEYLSRKRKQTT